MAIGLGCMFGFDFKENFNYPYIAGNMQDFWRRWHISLSTWFKEYVYIPMGGNRKGKLRTNLNKLTVFFLTGLWHGANFTFILWGLIHGFFLIIENVSKAKTFRIPDNICIRIIKHIYVCLVVVITFTIFRADSISQAFSMIKVMFSFKTGMTPSDALVLSCFSLLTIIAFILGVAFSTPIIPAIKNKIEKIGHSQLSISYEYISSLITLIMFVLCILLLVSTEYNPFLYFRF